MKAPAPSHEAKIRRQGGHVKLVLGWLLLSLIFTPVFTAHLPAMADTPSTFGEQSASPDITATAFGDDHCSPSAAGSDTADCCHSEDCSGHISCSPHCMNDAPVWAMAATPIPLATLLASAPAMPLKTVRLHLDSQPRRPPRQ